MVNLESVPDLIQHLCKRHLYFKDSRVADLFDRNKYLQEQKLKRKAFSALFSYLKSTKSRHLSSRNSFAFGIEEELSIYCFDLRNRHFYDDAIKLEQLIEAVSIQGKIDEQLKPAVKFLLCLKDTAEPQHPDTIGHCSEYQHDAYTKQAVAAVSFHLGSMRTYGATRLDMPMTSSYMHYPSDVFARPGTNTIHPVSGKYPFVNDQEFLMKPGFDLKEVEDKNSFEYKTAISLFGALVKSRRGTLNARLQLPDLPIMAEQTALDLKFPKLMDFSEDEGFMDALSSSGYSSLQSPMSIMKPSSVDIWDYALSHKANKCCKWEMVGSFAKKPERPFLSEAGPEAFDQLYCYHQQQLKMMDSSLYISPAHVITSKHLINDIRNVLIAVPSCSFHRNMHKFYVREGLCLSGISPMALKNLCNVAIQCGSDFLWLSQFSEAHQPSSAAPFSLALESFRSAIRNYLQHFVACIFRIPLLAALLEFMNIVRKSVNQIRFLVQLCMRACNDEENVFTGRHLLSCLYNECLAMEDSEHRQLLLSLLKTTCIPYLIFIHNWVFYGICKDDYGEFMIQANDDHLQNQDCHYWNKGFTLMDKDPSRTVPAFMANIANDIFLCGKSLNVLKLCYPMHFLFIKERDNLPELHLTFSMSELLLLERNSKIYFGRMQAFAHQFCRIRHELKIQAVKAKQELMVQAHKAAAEELKRLQERIAENRRKDNEKKQEFFAHLEEQLDQKTKRIEEERAKEKAEDKARVEFTTKQELLEASAHVETENQIREELVQYYAKLNEEAMHREQRALWRVRRHSLDQKRLNFLEADYLQIQELEKLKENKSDLVESGTLAERSQPLSVYSESRWIQDDPEQMHLKIKFFPKLSDIKHRVSAHEIKDATTTELNVLDKDDLMNTESSDSFSCEAMEKEEEDTLETGNVNKVLLANVIKGNSPDNESERKNILLTRELGDSSYKTSEQFLFKTASGNQVTDTLLKTHLIINSNMNATTETVPADERCHIKTVSGRYSTLESNEYDGKGRQHLKMNSAMSAAKASEETLPRIKLQNVFGHVSQISCLGFDVSAPRLKKAENLHATKESEWDGFTSYQIRPHRRKAVEGHSADKQTSNDSSLACRSHIKMNDFMNALTESKFLDVEHLRTERFLSHNIHGHSSNSTIQHLLYGNKHTEAEIPGKVTEESGDSSNHFLQVWTDNGIEEYTLKHSNLDELSMVDLVPWMPSNDLLSPDRRDLELSDFVSLPLLIKRSLMSPLNAQILLVNQNAVNYFMVELEIEAHFVALQKFLLLQDGEFSQSLCHQLFNKLSSKEETNDLLNPMFLNSVLHKAIASSLHGESKFSNAVSFTLKPIPQLIDNSGMNVLDYLVVTYKVDWPLNIVITESCLEKYAKIFNFMLKLRHVIWLLNAIFHRLKRDARVHFAGCSTEMKRLQLYRHEMQHFAKVIEEYIVSQVIHVSWHEFQLNLGSKISNIDDLIQCHVIYLNKCLARCLLTQNASSVMKIMQETFGLILKFNNHLISQSWQKDAATNRIYHPAFNSVHESYQAFHYQSSFLFKVVRNIAERHYQPHFQDLLVRLGFNEFYKLDQYAHSSPSSVCYA